MFAFIQIRSDFPAGQNIERVELRCSRKRAIRCAVESLDGRTNKSPGEISLLLERDGYLTDGVFTINVVRLDNVPGSVDLITFHERGAHAGLTLLVIEVICRSTNERGYMFSVRSGPNLTVIRKNGDVEDTLEEAELEGWKALDRVVAEDNERRRLYG